MGPGRLSRIRSPATLRAPTLPLSGYSTMSGAMRVDSMRTRMGESVPFRTWWNPSFPRGKHTTSPSESSLSPSGVRSVGRPRTTTSHSSLAWCVWYGHSRSPGSSSYMLPPSSSAPMRAPPHASLLPQPGRSSTRSHSSPLRLKTSTIGRLGAEAAQGNIDRSPLGASNLVLPGGKLPEHPAGQHLLETPVDDPARKTCVEVRPELARGLAALDHALHDREGFPHLVDLPLELSAAGDPAHPHGDEGGGVLPCAQEDLGDALELLAGGLVGRLDRP